LNISLDEQREKPGAVQQRAEKEEGEWSGVEGEGEAEAEDGVEMEECGCCAQYARALALYEAALAAGQAGVEAGPWQQYADQVAKLRTMFGQHRD